MRKAMLMMVLTLFVGHAYGADLGYDPQADPFEQYQQAIAAAEADNKLVLIIAGGDWCRWCHVLNRFVAKHADVERSLTDTFVVMKVYVGPGNYNELFFSQLPQAYGAPHFWVVSPEREVLGSQSTAKLERGKSSYDKEGFLAFIDSWRQHIDVPERHALAVDEQPAALNF